MHAGELVKSEVGLGADILRHSRRVACDTYTVRNTHYVSDENLVLFVIIVATGWNAEEMLPQRFPIGRTSLRVPREIC